MLYFMLWGNHAMYYERYIDTDKTHSLEMWTSITVKSLESIFGKLSFRWV